MTTILPAPRARLERELVQTVRLATPLVLGQLSAIGMNLVDALLAGHLAAHVLAAVAVGTSVWSLAVVGLIGVMMALPPSVAQLAGAGKREAVAPLFRQAVWLALGLGTAFGVAVYTAGPWLVSGIGVDASIVADVGRFLHAVAFGAPALALTFSLRGLGEGLGMTRPTMYFSVLGLVLLGPIGWMLMYGRLGLPMLGARGSGIATALVLWLQAAAFATYVSCSRHYRDLRLRVRWERPDPRILADLLKLGVPMSVTLLMESSLFVAVALLVGTLGADVVAGHQVALSVSAVAFMVPLGIGMATTVRVGHAAGRGDAAGVRLAGFVGIGLTLFTQAVSAGLMLTIPHAIAGLYTRDAAVVALGAQLLVLSGLFQFSDGIQVAASGALRGLKDTRVPMLITSFAYWGVGMPVGWWLAFPRALGARGMWMGLIAGLSIAAVLLLWRFGRLARVPAPQ